MLGVNNKTKHDLFSARHRDLLINLASYAAVAIENARRSWAEYPAAARTEGAGRCQRGDERFALVRVTLPAICEQLIQVLNVGHAEIYTWDDETMQLSLLARRQQASWRSGQEPAISAAERPAIRYALESQKPVFIEADDSPNTDAILEETARARCWSCRFSAGRR